MKSEMNRESSSAGCIFTIEGSRPRSGSCNMMTELFLWTGLSPTVLVGWTGDDAALRELVRCASVGGGGESSVLGRFRDCDPGSSAVRSSCAGAWGADGMEGRRGGGAGGSSLTRLATLGRCMGAGLGSSLLSMEERSIFSGGAAKSLLLRYSARGGHWVCGGVHRGNKRTQRRGGF